MSGPVGHVPPDRTPDAAGYRAAVRERGDDALVTCRCSVLNNLTGEQAADYARHHLDVTRADTGRVTTYRCPETGIEWVEERAPTAYDDSTRRLRRMS